MKINRVTITGADNNVNPYDLWVMSGIHHFVEWGILFTGRKEGYKRYPNQEWIKLVCLIQGNLSAHFCGSWAKDVVEKQNFDLITNLNPKFKRVQLNYRFTSINSDEYLDMINNYCIEHPERAIILQYNKGNKTALDSFIQEEHAKNIHFLYDSSGGNGKVISEIKEPFNTYTGYAGGLNPENVEDVCKMIYANKNESEVWIDLESGARTNNEFDVQKVNNILWQVGSIMDNATL